MRLYILLARDAVALSGNDFQLHFVRGDGQQGLDANSGISVIETRISWRIAARGLCAPNPHIMRCMSSLEHAVLESSSNGAKAAACDGGVKMERLSLNP